MKSQLLDPRSLQPNPWNSNRVNPANLEKLKRSIADLGFVSAVVVRELEGGELQILGGQHRVEVAVDLGLRTVPVLNLGAISEAKAKKIGLVDNSRYGTDDSISLAKLYEEIGMSSEELANFLPFTQADFELITSSVDINLEELDMLGDDDDLNLGDTRPARVSKTHDLLRFRVTLSDAERIRRLIETTMKAESLTDDDELTAAGSALALLLLSPAE